MRMCTYNNCGSPVFATDKKTGKGYCKMHQTKRTDLDRRSLIVKAMEKQKRLNSKIKGLENLPQNIETKQENDLVMFFKEAAKVIELSPYCMECGAYISKKYYKAATAHILPKKQNIGGFPSVADHPKNYLVLGGGCGCHNKTHRWDTFSKMKVWPLAVSRFKEIYPAIAKSELKYLPEVLLKEINKLETI